MSSIFPLAHIKNVRLFYLLTFFTNGWFINANWIFLALLYMSKTQLGLIDSGSFLIGTLFDLPSGALADLIGRRRIIIISRFIFAVSCLIFIVSFNAWTFTIANILFFIGQSFYAGADQALLYDSLRKHHQEGSYIKVIARSDLICRISTFLASLIGAAVFILNLRYPFVLLFVFALFALIISLKLEEIDIQEKRRVFKLKDFVNQQFDGIKVLTDSSLRYYFPIFFVILGTFIMFGWGILRGFIALMYNLGGSEQTLIFGSLSFIVGLLCLVLPKAISKSSDYKVSLGLSLLFCIGFLLAGLYTDSKIWGILVLLIISLSGGILNVLSQKIVNDEVSSNLRATALSALSIVTKLPYILAAYLVGFYADNNQLILVTRLIFILAVSAILISVFIRKIKSATSPEFSSA